MGEPVELALAPGLYSNETDRGAKGRWKDGNHVRFKNRLPEKIGGSTIITRTGAQVVGYTAGKIHGLARSLHDWVALDGTKWVAIGTHRKLYVFHDSVLYDITPIRDTEALVDPFTTTSGSATVVVNDPSHGALLGDFVTFSGASAVGGITINGNYEITEIIDNANYKIVHSSAASSNAVGGGAVTADYEINIGEAGYETTGGYGLGPYGGGSYGSPITISEDEAAAQEIRIWSLDNWGEDLIASPRGGRIYVWDKSVGPATRAQLIANSPMYNNRVFVGQEERILISAGAANGVGDRDQLLIRWSDQEDYNTWTAAITNRAGSRRVQVGSRILSGVKTKREIVIFTDNALFGMQYVGGNDVYAISPLGRNTSIAGPNAGSEVNDVVHFMGKSNFFVYDGIVKEIPCDVWTHVFNDFNVIRAESVVCMNNQNFNEVWWFYPSSMSSLNDRYVVYNYRERWWSYGTWDRSAVHDYSVVFRRPYAVDSSGNFVRHEDGDNDVDANAATVSLDSFIESYDSEIADGRRVMLTGRLIPDFDELVGSGTITLKSRRYPNATQRTKGPYTVSSATEMLGVRVRDRQIALRWDQTGVNKRWRMGTWRVSIKQAGAR